MPDSHIVEGDVLATFAIDSLRSGQFAVDVVVEPSDIRRNEVIHLKCDTTEGDVTEIRRPDQASSDEVVGFLAVGLLEPDY